MNIKKFRFFCFLISLGALTSLFLILAAKDVFAFDKSGGTVAVVIAEDTSAARLSGTLKDSGVIEMPAVFRLYSAFRKKNAFRAGEYTLSPSMSYDEIYAALSGKKSREQIKITIPEGTATDGIINIFTEAGIGTKEEFYAALADDYGYDYIPDKPAGRTYRYDGYLYPDTYFFYSDATPKDAVAKMLKNFDVKFSEKLFDAAKKNGVGVDECVTVASIIQKEAYYTAEMGALSSVIYNRLSSRTLRRLECDSTVSYAWQTGGEGADFLSVDSPYNTYRSEGLPPGAICSPGMAALEAAANPKKTDYYYFFSKSDKTFVFSKTHAEHLAQRRKHGV